MGNPLRRLAAWPLRHVLDVAGRAYVPGHRLEDALAVARRQAAQGIACSIGYFHNWRESPAQLLALSRSIVDATAALEPRGYLSIKAPAFRYDPEVIAALATATHDAGTLAHFDSHEPHTADATLACARQAAALGAAVGITLPGRWPRSLADADEACALGLRVRVVKGEWADPLAPAHDLRQGYLAVVDRLAGRARAVAIATHEPRLAREALSRLQAAGTPCEVELLHGLPSRPLLALAREFAVPVRLYIPFGIAWRPYAAGKAATNPRILWWILHDAATGLRHQRHRPPA